MTTTYDVRVYKTEVWKGKRTITYYVRWKVGARPWKEPFRTCALADSFRSELVAAARGGEAFDVATGRPISVVRAESTESWYGFACSYVDMKWLRAAGKSRMGNADALATVTPALLLPTGRGCPPPEVLRGALYGWAFNTRSRTAGPPPAELRPVIAWIERNTVPISELAKPETLRAALDALGRKMDGQPAAASTGGRKRAVFHNALDYAVERGLLAQNPLQGFKATKDKTAEAVDRRVVVNHDQAKRLLDAVRAQGRTGEHLVLFFALLYYAALRPAEAADLGTSALSVPGEGWGELYLPGSAPTTGAAWGDSGARRDKRGLKHRPRNEVRIVPCAPPLTALIHEHLSTFGTTSDGQLFRGARGGDLSDSTYGRVWQQARRHALSIEDEASPLARRPYDLRHAAVSTWLNGGVEPTRVAEWAGHSVAVLLRVYAKCIAGQEATARHRVGLALGLPTTATTDSAS
jgi:integrase